MTNIRNAFSAVIGLTLLGSSLLLGAGVASAATCPAGQHWNEMGAGAGFCSPDASGGGTGGDIVIDLGGSTPQAPTAPIFQAPTGNAPVRGTLPPPPPPAPIPPRPVAPAPAPVQAPKAQLPAPQIQAPAKNYVSTTPSGQLPVPNQGVASAPVKDSAMVEETNPGNVAPTEDVAPSTTPTAEESVAPAEAPSTVSASPSASATPTSELVINPAAAGDSQPSPASLAGFALAGGVIGFFVAFYIVRFFRTRKIIAATESTDS